MRPRLLPKTTPSAFTNTAPILRQPKLTIEQLQKLAIHTLAARHYFRAQSVFYTAYTLPLGFGVRGG